jgi:glycosyltransferase involved in cell wall biosynthesis
MNRLRIAYIGQRGVPPTYGGIERYVDEIVRRLPPEEVETFAYCRRHYVEQDNITYTRQLFIPSLETKGFEAFSHSFLSALDSLRHSFDLTHFQALGPALFSWIPRLSGAKVIVTVHGLDWQRAKWGRAARAVISAGDWMMGHNASAIISVSKNLKTYYEKKYKREVFFVPIGFSEPKHLEINQINFKFGLRPLQYILFLSRLVPEKGIHYLIAAFKELTRDDVNLVIAGPSEPHSSYFNYLRDMAKDDKRIIFTGAVSRDEVHELYSNAYLFSLPSDLEGMPAVLLESLSHKCPVLISDIRENLDVIRSGGVTHGFVHKASDVNDIRKQLDFLLEHPDLVCDMRQRGFDFVNREYSWERTVKSTLEIYKHVLRL